jgi:hypothetical protein
MNEFLLLAVVVVYLAILYGKPTIESPAPESLHSRPFGYSPDYDRCKSGLFVSVAAFPLGKVFDLIRAQAISSSLLAVPPLA